MNDDPPIEETDASQMAKYGITREPADRFRYKEYRYSRLSDAVAQARRDAPPL